MFFFVSLLPVLVFCLPQPFASEFPNLTCTPVGTGLSARVPLCTPALPCVHLLASYAALGITTINVSDFGAPNSLPLSLGSSQQCSTRPAISPASDARNDGALSSLVVEGMTRYFCQFAPAGQGLPLLIDFPGSGGFARNAYTTTRFRQKAETEVIKPGVTGYVFVSMSPLNRHWPPSGLIGPTEDGAKQDFLYRNYSDNEDVKFIDELINSLVSSGKVDQRYIFLSGHSNGAQFAHFYGIVRASIPSKHGHRVAAVSAFSGADPFGAVGGDANCALVNGGVPPSFNYPRASNLPLLLIGSWCDVVPCSAQQLFISTTMPNVIGVSSNVTLILLDDNQQRVFACDTNCSASRAQANHGDRPISWEPTIMDFFRRSVTAATGTTRPAAAAASEAVGLLILLLLFLMFLC